MYIYINVPFVNSLNICNSKCITCNLNYCILNKNVYINKNILYLPKTIQFFRLAKLERLKAEAYSQKSEVMARPPRFKLKWNVLLNLIFPINYLAYGAFPLCLFFLNGNVLF